VYSYSLLLVRNYKAYKDDTFTASLQSEIAGWPPFGHESIEHEPLTALEQWKASRHRSLWLVMSNWSVSSDPSSETSLSRDSHTFLSLVRLDWILINQRKVH